jgi:hypothetical protein
MPLLDRRSFFKGLVAAPLALTWVNTDTFRIGDFGEFEVEAWSDFMTRGWVVAVAYARSGKWYARGVRYTREEMMNLTGKSRPTQEDAKAVLTTAARQIIAYWRDMPYKPPGAQIEIVRFERL